MKKENLSNHESEKNTKSHVTLITILVVLLLIASFGFGYALCGTNFFSELVVGRKKPQNSGKSEKLTEELDTISLNSLLVKEAEKFVPEAFCGGINLDLEKRDKDISDISDIDKIRMLLSLGMCGKTESELETYFKDLSFLDVVKPAIDTCTDSRNGEPCHAGAKTNVDIGMSMYMKYDDGKFVCETYGMGCIGGGNDGDYFSLLDAKKNDTTLILDYLHYYKDVDYDSETDKFINNIYKEKGDTNLLYSFENNQYFVEKMKEIDKTKFDGYQYVFDISEGNIWLKKINYLATLS